MIVSDAEAAQKIKNETNLDISGDIRKYAVSLKDSVESFKYSIKNGLFDIALAAMDDIPDDTLLTDNNTNTKYLQTICSTVAGAGATEKIEKSRNGLVSKILDDTNTEPLTFDAFFQLITMTQVAECVDIIMGFCEENRHPCTRM